MLKMNIKNVSFILLGLVLANTQKTETHIQCFIIQKKETIDVSLDFAALPSFLKSDNKTLCQVHKTDQEMLRCGQTDVYIRPECVCSFYNVFEATFYHEHSSCPKGAESDIVTQLKCADCKRYSLNNNGPCTNGGKLICTGEEVAPDVTCQCPPNYEGAFCENKIENITRICNKISNYSSYDLENCDETSSECVTYSRNRRYAYRCQETDTSHDRRGLPLCIDTENTTPNPTEISSVDSDQKRPGEHYTSGTPAFQFSSIFVVVFSVVIFKI